MASLETPLGWSPLPLKNKPVLLYGTRLSSRASSPDDSSISSFTLFCQLCSLVVAAVIGPKDDALVEQVRLHNPDVVILVEIKVKVIATSILLRCFKWTLCNRWNQGAYVVGFVFFGKRMQGSHLLKVTVSALSSGLVMIGIIRMRNGGEMSGGNPVKEEAIRLGSAY